MSVVRCCRTPGSLVTMNWAAPRGFARNWRSRNECYLLAVPSNTLKVRDPTAPDPPYSGRGPRPKIPFSAGRPLVC